VSGFGELALGGDLAKVDEGVCCGTFSLIGSVLEVDVKFEGWVGFPSSVFRPSSDSGFFIASHSSSSLGEFWTSCSREETEQLDGETNPDFDDEPDSAGLSLPSWAILWILLSSLGNGIDGGLSAKRIVDASFTDSLEISCVSDRPSTFSALSPAFASFGGQDAIGIACSPSWPLWSSEGFIMFLRIECVYWISELLSLLLVCERQM